MWNYNGCQWIWLWTFQADSFLVSDSKFSRCSGKAAVGNEKYTSKFYLKISWNRVKTGESSLVIKILSIKKASAFWPSLYFIWGQLSLNCCCSVTKSCPTLCDPWTAVCQASLSITNSQCLLKFMPIESVMPSNHLILCHPLFLMSLIFPSIMVFSNELTLHIRWPKHWSFSFNISSSNEYSGWVSFWID